MRRANTRKTAQVLLSWMWAASPVAQASPMLATNQTEHSRTIGDNASTSPKIAVSPSVTASGVYEQRVAKTPPPADITKSALRPKGSANFEFGPFVVISNSQAVLLRETDSDSPRDFSAMLKQFPDIKTLELPDCPGTLDDNANLQLAQMIHDRGISTDVPKGGSVRSGAVDLFLAGLYRTTAPDAKFAIHAWIDEDGHRPSNFAADDPINRRYVQFYYHTAGMAEPAAVRFYNLANSVPFENALWLTPSQIAQFADIKILTPDSAGKTQDPIHEDNKILN